MPTISVYLTGEVLEKLDSEAERLGVSRSKAIAVALGGGGYVDRLEALEVGMERVDKFLSTQAECGF